MTPAEWRTAREEADALVLKPGLQTLTPKPEAQDANPYTLHPKSQTLNLKFQISYPKPQPPNSKPQPTHPKPETLNPNPGAGSVELSIFGSDIDPRTVEIIR